MDVPRHRPLAHALGVDPNKTIFHETWAVQDACGRVQKLEPNSGHTECQFCPPDASSRTHRARQDNRQLLYMVGFEDLLESSHGDEARIGAHLRAGATVIQVVEASQVRSSEPNAR